MKQPEENLQNYQLDLEDILNNIDFPSFANLYRRPQLMGELIKFTFQWAFFESVFHPNRKGFKPENHVRISKNEEVEQFFDVHIPFLLDRYMNGKNANLNLERLFDCSSGLNKQATEYLGKLTLINVGGSFEEKKEAFLIVLGRVRNNFFHGNKLTYNLSDDYADYWAGQEELFNLLNGFLCLCIKNKS